MIHLKFLTKFTDVDIHYVDILVGGPRSLVSMADDSRRVGSTLDMLFTVLERKSWSDNSHARRQIKRTYVFII